MPQLDATDLDFDQIKQNMIDHFTSLPDGPYADWNFEGAGLSQLMDVLAYNTHYNALVAQMSVNEVFLPSAQLRGNVVSAAKTLGYVPRSITAATVDVNVVVTPTGTPPSSISLQRGTRFSTVTNSTQYTFTALDTVQINLIGGVYTFSNLTLTQGTLKRMLYVVDPSIIRQKFVIPDANVDTTTLQVRVKVNSQSDQYAVYTPFTTLTGVTGSSQIYFVQQNYQGLYEIYFGDGVIGAALEANNVVEIEYIYTDGTSANGASKFYNVDTVSGFSGVAVTLANPSSPASGSSPAEGTESVRYNAPLAYITQDRAVTADDYRAIILKYYGNIQTISVWGGEDQPTPDYGKVFICIKPNGADTLTVDQKNEIVQTILAGKNVVSITPVMVDPEYTYLALVVYFKYNSNLTDLNLIDLQSAVANTIASYNTNFLESFDGVFRYSQLLGLIDATDPSILNSDMVVTMYKVVTPINTVPNTFQIQYAGPIKITNTSDSIIKSSPFLINGVTCYFGDAPIAGSINRTVFVYKLVNGVPVTIQTVGNIDSANGIINITNFQPDATTPIQISVPPASNDLAPKRTQLLEIDTSQLTVSGSIDTIAVSGAAGAIDYTTPTTNS